MTRIPSKRDKPRRKRPEIFQDLMDIPCQVDDETTLGKNIERRTVHMKTTLGIIIKPIPRRRATPRKKKDLKLFKPEPEHIKIDSEGREKIDRESAAGKAEWRKRIDFVYRRDEGRCKLQLDGCESAGNHFRLLTFVIDHRLPKGMGGSTHDDRVENLQLSCWNCNSLKGSKRI